MSRKEAIGILSGYHSFDTILSGFIPGQVYVIAASPAVGKTALLINLAINALRILDKKNTVLFFTLELSKNQLLERIYSCLSGVPLGKIRKKELSEKEIELLHQNDVSKRLDQHLILTDTSAIQTEHILNKLSETELHSIQIIFIDYLQLLSAEKHEFQEDGILEIMKELKRITVEFNVPIVVTSQLKKKSDLNKEEQIPKLKDLPGSGEIEKIADVVMLLHRPEFISDTNNEIPQSIFGETHVHIVKNNSGELGTVKLTADFQRQRYYEKKSNNE